LYIGIKIDLKYRTDNDICIVGSEQKINRFFSKQYIKPVDGLVRRLIEHLVATCTDRCRALGPNGPILTRLVAKNRMIVSKKLKYTIELFSVVGSSARESPFQVLASYHISYQILDFSFSGNTIRFDGGDRNSVSGGTMGQLVPTSRLQNERKQQGNRRVRVGSSETLKTGI